ncbi:Cytoplasmic phosphatidylinositol transfer protein 1 [Labeo rohita]|uniref:Cytoplasmic phosphatidylinositol transfer protein 1 n=1 Tax=Labeo rohita TaxID=84645 RepID=A0ABQ8LXL5_LABRO|nr:Cytoplasmic phosphatidylinositol transfer protein 1 [Labeo rohita]
MDLSNWVSEKTGRGPLVDGWRNTTKPIMCSYKRVTCSFEVYGFQGRTEDFIHRNIRDILLVGHRQAVAWIDEWHGMTLEEVREYERKQQEETNSKLKNSAPPVRPSFTRSISVTDESSLKKMGVKTVDIPSSPSCPSSLKNPLRLNSTPE